MPGKHQAEVVSDAQDSFHAGTSVVQASMAVLRYFGPAAGLGLRSNAGDNDPGLSTLSVSEESVMDCGGGRRCWISGSRRPSGARAGAAPQ